MATQTSIQLEQKIFDLSDRINAGVDRMHVGCTVMLAMDDDEIEDLLAMILWMQDRDEPTGLILANVMHDINGFAAIYHHVPGSDCFSPRSSGYSTVLAKKDGD